jgi:hypothetical protein
MTDNTANSTEQQQNTDKKFSHTSSSSQKDDFSQKRSDFIKRIAEKFPGIPFESFIEKDLRDIPGSCDWDSTLQSTFLAMQEEARSYRPPIFQPLSFSDLLSLPRKNWLVNGILGPKDIGMIYGAPGCGKTFVVIDLIMRMCMGLGWARRFFIQKKLSVAYCAGEGFSGLSLRFAAAAKNYEISDLSNFKFFKTIPQLYDISDQSITQFINEWKATDLGHLDVLVIDTLHTASIGAEENSSQDMGKVLQSCKKAASDLGCAVILVHHTNKGGTAERGSSALRGAMDFMIEISSDGNPNISAIMKCSKLKDGEQWKEQGFKLKGVDGCSSVCVEWNDIEFSNEEDINVEEKIMGVLRAYPDMSFPVKAIADKIGYGDTMTRRALVNLEKLGMCKVQLKEQHRQQSPSNPWLYSLNSS